MSREQTRLSYELHKPKRVRFPTRSVTMKGIDDTWQADLVEMQHLVKWNKQHKYLLTVIDTFSKYAFVRPLKAKTAEEVANAFADILLKSKRTPTKLHTDRGKEFFNTKFQGLMEKHGIHHYHTYTDKKASIVERFNRSFKTRMYREFTRRNTLKWADLLPELINQYNHTRHSTIQEKPALVTKKNEAKVMTVLKKSQRKKKMKRMSLKLGDIVRISRVKGTFSKGYTPNWTEELFRIIEVKGVSPLIYKIEDLAGTPIKGTFYRQELQKTMIPDYARIEKVIGRKVVDGRRMIRVKWKGYDNRFNQWIPLEKSSKL